MHKLLLEKTGHMVTWDMWTWTINKPGGLTIRNTHRQRNALSMIVNQANKRMEYTSHKSMGLQDGIIRIAAIRKLGSSLLPKAPRRQLQHLRIENTNLDSPNNKQPLYDHVQRPIIPLPPVKGVEFSVYRVIEPRKCNSGRSISMSTQSPMHVENTP